MIPDPLTEALDSGATYAILDGDDFVFYRVLENDQTQKRTASALKWLGGWKKCPEIPLEAKAIDSLRGQYEAAREVAVQEFYSKVESDLTESNRYELSALDWKFNWKVLRAGYLTADMALYSGYLFVLLPKVIIVIVAFLLYFRSEQIGIPKLLVMLVAWGILAGWDWWFARILWLRWVSGAILPEEAKSFYTLDPAWLMIGGQTWEKMISSLNGLNDVNVADEADSVE